MDEDVVVGRDVSVKLVEEAQRRGHEVFFYRPTSLAFACGELVAEAFSVRVGADSLHMTKLGFRWGSWTCYLCGKTPLSICDT